MRASLENAYRVFERAPAWAATLRIAEALAQRSVVSASSIARLARGAEA